MNETGGRAYLICDRTDNPLVASALKAFLESRRETRHQLVSSLSEAKEEIVRLAERYDRGELLNRMEEEDDADSLFGFDDHDLGGPFDVFPMNAEDPEMNTVVTVQNEVDPELDVEDGQVAHEPGVDDSFDFAEFFELFDDTDD